MEKAGLIKVWGVRDQPHPTQGAKAKSLHMRGIPLRLACKKVALFVLLKKGEHRQYQKIKIDTNTELTEHCLEEKTKKGVIS